MLRQRNASVWHVGKACFYSILVLVTLTFSGVVSAQSDDLPKYEIGGQFTVLWRHKPTPIFQSPTSVGANFPRDTRVGFGGRFTYNITNNVAVEAEGNFIPKTEDFTDLSTPTGHMYQGQFGIKAGKRFSKVGIFAKLRPGLVRFSEVSRQTGSHTITFNNQQFTVGDFRIGSKNYFSTDAGAVIEFYPSRRTIARVDVGDTIIHYSVYRRSSFFVSQPFIERPAETRHNFQLSFGFGFRF